MQEFNYEEVKIGDVFKTSFTLTKEIVHLYHSSLNEVFIEGLPAPSSILGIYKPWYDAFGGRVAQGTIHLKQRMEYYSNVYIEDEFEVVVSVCDKYRKKGRDYLIHETNFYKSGLLVCKQTTTQLWAYAAN
ncbi:hypothetical protein [Peribacillus sp. NPDC058002]|uniref:hypothetical protein n=1 Tax=Peribacillus sp. NPDC058002 TaxID=3346301 RepID=UPI0036DE4AFD